MKSIASSVIGWLGCMINLTSSRFQILWALFKKNLFTIFFRLTELEKMRCETLISYLLGLV